MTPKMLPAAVDNPLAPGPGEMTMMQIKLVKYEEIIFYY